MRMTPLRKLCAGAIAATAVLGLAACGASGPTRDANNSNPTTSAGAIHITDVTNRTVDFSSRPERIVLAEGRGLFVTSFLNKDNPTANVVAVGSDLHTGAPSFEAKLAEAHSEYKSLPHIGVLNKGDVTVEGLMSHKPDVVVFALDHKKPAEESGLLKKMDQANLKYVFTDLRQKPLDNTTKTVDIYGQLFGRQDKAREFNEFYTAKLKSITERAAKADKKPRTLVWRAAGMNDCCGTVKNSNLGDLVNAAGGHNIGDDLLSTESGSLTAEKVVAEQPEYIIATGGSWAKNDSKPETIPHVELGYAAQPATAEATLKGLLNTPGFNTLKAPEQGHMYAVYHQFYDSPFNIFALEQFAQWLHPETFSDLDATRDFADFHSKWMPFEFSGTFFTSMPR